MSNPVRATASSELKSAVSIIDESPHGWWALHTALVAAARSLRRANSDLLDIASHSLRHVEQVAFGRGADDASVTRFTAKSIMAWQDAMYVVNELPEWRFPDDVLLVGWLVECGGPEMRRGPARASFQNHSPDHYVGGTRRLYNEGKHGNGAGWPESRVWTAKDCRYMQ
jgi:hypothetical protein